jgi:hypothetical protein
MAAATLPTPRAQMSMRHSRWRQFGKLLLARVRFIMLRINHVRTQPEWFNDCKSDNISMKSARFFVAHH